MQFIEKYKAIIITALIMGIVLAGMYSIHITKKGEIISESFYDITPEPEKDSKELDDFANLKNPSSDRAFNEDKAYKEMMKNFKTLDSRDFERTTKALAEAETDTNTDEVISDDAYPESKDYALKPEETDTYKQLQEALKKQKDIKNQADAHAKTQSTLTYSLKDRLLTNYKTPRYLCERSGKIVISITVDGSGSVVGTSVNGASSSKDQCLIDSALDYAKSAQFDSAPKTEQIGTITFYFKGKN